MTLEERTTWAGLVSLVAVPLAYVAWLVARGGVPSAGWEWPLAVAFGALVVLGVVGSVVVAVVAAVQAERDGAADEFGRADERDAGARDRGARWSSVALGAWVVVVFVLALAGVAHVWIAHALLAAVVTAGTVDAMARIAAYRWGW